jgi:hypothetical protein
LELSVRDKVTSKVLAKGCVIYSKKLFSDRTVDLNIDISIALNRDLLSSCPEKIAVRTCLKVDKAGDFVKDINCGSRIQDYRVPERVLSNTKCSLRLRDKET